jgi:hypothetical protein
VVAAGFESECIGLKCTKQGAMKNFASQMQRRLCYGLLRN